MTAADAAVVPVPLLPEATYELDFCVSDAADFFALPNLVRDLAQAYRSHAGAPAPACADSAAASAPLLMRVALQFPDVFLHLAAPVYDYLTENCLRNEGGDAAFDFYILADSQSSPCCCDSIAARHVDAHLLVIFGRSCLGSSWQGDVPIIRVFGQIPVSLELLKLGTESMLAEPEHCDAPPNVVYLYDVMHSHITWPQHESRRFVCAATESLIQEVLESAELPRVVVYVGPQSPLVSHLAMQYCGQPFYHYDSIQNTMTRATLNQLVRRQRMVHVARDAQVVGILVSAYSSKNYIALIDAVKRALIAKGKKHYTFALSKLNVMKLANFAEIGVFVLISCPQSTLIDSKEFLAPVVTPYELAVALEMSNAWGSEYVLQFSQLAGRFDSVAHAAENSSDARDSDDDRTPHFSPITGKMQSGRWFESPQQRFFMKKISLEDDASEQNVGAAKHVSGDKEAEDDAKAAAAAAERALTKRAEFHVVSPSAAYFAHTRSWRGLDVAAAHDKPLQAVPGRHGTSAGYAGEPN